jgi:hypothetical protein
MVPPDDEQHPRAKAPFTATAPIQAAAQANLSALVRERSRPAQPAGLKWSASGVLRPELSSLYPDEGVIFRENSACA